PRTALHLDSLALGPRAGAFRLAARGIAGLEDDTPFTVDLVYAPDGRLTGGADFQLGAPDRIEHLPVAFDARLQHARGPRARRLARGSTIGLGPIPFRVAGAVEPAGPRVTFSLRAAGLDPDALERRVPAALLGPLARVRVAGTFDYALDFDLD